MSDYDSDDSEQAFCFFGTPLDPLDKDEIPRKKPISVEEQIATDSHGRRRFHGAFTGGFSAGFFNTVGSLEGWAPNDFKSSRTEKAQIMVQKPEDFMDDEDVGEFGIAPKTVKATRDYSTTKKRKRMLANGPIPGEPVLNTFISSGNETIGYLLLKNIGIQDKIAKKNRELGISPAKVYGCEMPSAYEISGSIEKKLYNMPTMYIECLANPKNNTFGIGYKGLDRSCNNVLSSSSFLVKGQNKTIHVTGQAFGVGAFEEEDDDIYSKDDLSNYDFELTQEKTTATNSGYNSDLIFSIFRKNNVPLLSRKQFSAIVIPPGFSGKHKKRISRFEPVRENLVMTCEKPKINPSVRAKYLGDGDEKALNLPQHVTKIKTNSTVSTTEDKIHSLLSLDRFVSASHKEEINNILEPVQKTVNCYASQQMQDAVKMRMFGPLTRTTSDWHPHPHLCERFNVPEPFMDKPQTKQNKRRKNLIFEQQTCIEESSIFKPGISEESKKSEFESNSDLSDSTAQHQINIDADNDGDEVNRKMYESEIKQNTVLQSATVKDTVAQSETIPNTVQQSEKVKDNDSDIELSKTDVKNKDITEKINIAEKVDLFKAVFLSSDEEEEEMEHEQISSKDESHLLKAVVSEPLIPIVKNAKQGILSNLSFSNLPGECSTNAGSNKDGCTVKNEVNALPSVSLYGPCLPVQKCKGSIHISQANIQMNSDSSDEWVEKDDTSHKKKHKNKKKKAKHKKHKKHKKHSS